LDHGTVVHLDCYGQTEGPATLVYTFLEKHSGRQYCYTCLAVHLVANREQIEKATYALRLARSVVVEPALCSTCRNARVTVRCRQETET
jgi:hypothetical protein